MRRSATVTTRRSHHLRRTYSFSRTFAAIEAFPFIFKEGCRSSIRAHSRGPDVRQQRSPISSAAMNENARLRALDEYAVFDTPADTDLDRLVELAARMYGTPVAALSLVGKERLFFKSRFGMEATGIGREGKLLRLRHRERRPLSGPRCAQGCALCLPPAGEGGAEDPLLRGDSADRPSGQKIGTLCILDTKPWPEFTDDDRKNLEDVADLVMNRLELRRLDRAKQAGHLALRAHRIDLAGRDRRRRLLRLHQLLEQGGRDPVRLSGAGGHGRAHRPHLSPARAQAADRRAHEPRQLRIFRPRPPSRSGSSPSAATGTSSPPSCRSRSGARTAA